MSKPQTPQQKFIEKQQARLLEEKGQKVEPIFLRFVNTSGETQCLFLEPWGTWITLEDQEAAVVVSFYPLRWYQIDINGSNGGCITLHCDEPTEVFDKDGNPLYV